MRYTAFFALILFPFFAFAQTGETASQWDIPVPQEFVSCENSYAIIGPSQVKIGSAYEYKISTGSGEDISGAVKYTLKRDGEIVETMDDKEKYLRYFTTPGEVTLEAQITESPSSCTGSITKRIRVYDSVLAYVGSERSGIETGMKDVFEKNNILFESYVDKPIISQTAEIQEILDTIDRSDTFIVGYKDILGFFSDIAKLQKTKQLDFSKKKIYIISDFSRAFLSKVLASSLSQIGATKVFLISDDQFYSLITHMSVGDKNITNIGQELSYEKSQTIYSLSGLLEFLAYTGFSYQLLALLLSITFIVLVLNFLKQIVWFNVFGIYYPVLLAITIVSLGLSGAFIFSVIGFVSIVAVNLFSKKVHLLLHAKRSLLISLYIMFFLFFLGIDNFFELSLINYTIFDNSLIIFPLFITVILADKIFQEDVFMLGKSWIIDILQYGVVTFIIYMLFEYKTLQYFLISYPDIIILVVIMNIVVGRYMWLQAFEYFRFSPLLRKLNEEE